MSLKLFITGASGYLGSVLAAQLASMPEVEGITGTVNTNWPSTSMPDNVKLVQIDIRSPDLADVMAGHDVVLHTAFVVLWLKKMPKATRDDINFNSGISPGIQDFPGPYSSDFHKNSSQTNSRVNIL